MQEAEHVDGLGTQAYFIPGTHAVCVSTNGYDLTVTVDPRLDPTASRDQATGLARIALSRM